MTKTIIALLLLIIPQSISNMTCPAHASQSAKHTHPAHPRARNTSIARVTDFAGQVCVIRHGAAKPIQVSIGFQIVPHDTISVSPASSVSVSCLACRKNYEWSAGSYPIDCSDISVQDYLKSIRQADDTAAVIQDMAGNLVVRGKGTDPVSCIAAIIQSRGAAWSTGISLPGLEPILSAEQVESMRDEILAEDGQQRRSHDSQHYLMAMVYALRQRYDDGITELQMISDGHKNDPDIQILLGDLMLAGGYDNGPKEAYKTAAKSAHDRKDSLSEAVAYHGLAFYETLIEDMPISQNSFLTKATILYKASGYTETAIELKGRLTNAIPNKK